MGDVIVAIILIVLFVFGCFEVDRVVRFIDELYRKTYGRKSGKKEKKKNKWYNSGKESKGREQMK